MISAKKKQNSMFTQRRSMVIIFIAFFALMIFLVLCTTETFVDYKTTLPFAPIKLDYNNVKPSRFEECLQSTSANIPTCIDHAIPYNPNNLRNQIHPEMKHWTPILEEYNENNIISTNKNDKHNKMFQENTQNISDKIRQNAALQNVHSNMKDVKNKTTLNKLIPRKSQARNNHRSRIIQLTTKSKS